jgi:hypothetical protein
MRFKAAAALVRDNPAHDDLQRSVWRLVLRIVARIFPHSGI